MEEETTSRELMPTMLTRDYNRKQRKRERVYDRKPQPSQTFSWTVGLKKVQRRVWFKSRVLQSLLESSQTLSNSSLNYWLPWIRQLPFDEEQLLSQRPKGGCSDRLLRSEQRKRPEMDSIFHSWFETKEGIDLMKKVVLDFESKSLEKNRKSVGRSSLKRKCEKKTSYSIRSLFKVAKNIMFLFPLNQTHRFPWSQRKKCYFHLIQRQWRMKQMRLEEKMA